MTALRQTDCEQQQQQPQPSARQLTGYLLQGCFLGSVGLRQRVNLPKAAVTGQRGEYDKPAARRQQMMRQMLLAESLVTDRGSYGHQHLATVTWRHYIVPLPQPLHSVATIIGAHYCGALRQLAAGSATGSV